MKLTCAALSLFLAGNAAARAEAPFSFAATPGKLSKAVVPASYHIHLVPDIAAMTFRAAVRVELDVRSPASQLELNALELQVDRARLHGPGLDIPLHPAYDEKRQTITFALDKPLGKGAYSLEMDYRGRIGKQSFGLYANTYQSAVGDKVFLGTKMEPTDARRLVPSWDEPAFRARFTLAVDLPARFTPYSNTEIERIEQLPGGLRRHSFKTTPKMSSYLLVLVAGEFERISAQQDGVELGVVATHGKVANGRYALASAQGLLNYYNVYFGVPFPLKKLDLIGVPGGFSGAEEDWGAIPFKESYLLYDPLKSSDSTRRNVFEVVAHEMAHQWFGDLVTMAWWDNLWLNEGFASWMSNKATDHFNPDWHVWLGAGESAMAFDARITTHPIQQRIANEEQAADAFDEIAYTKGQAIVRMMESYIGPGQFQAGIRAYMRQHQYSNTTSADLWHALARASGKPPALIERVASGWTRQPGFPLLSVAQSCQRGVRTVTLSQQQFRADEGDGVKRSWLVPLRLGELGGKVDTVLLNSEKSTLRRSGCAGLLLLDPEAVGYFRVRYAPAMFDALAAQFPALPDNARMRLLSDTWALVGSGQSPLQNYMDLVRRLGDEPRYAVWAQVLGNLAALDALAAGDPSRTALRAFALKLVAPKFAGLGWDAAAGESADRSRLRAALLSALSLYGDPDVAQEARRRFALYLADPASLAPSLINPVIYMAGANADQATYAMFKQRAGQATSLEEKSRFYYAMFGARDPQLAAQSLALALSPELIPAIRNGLVAYVGRGENAALAWAFARTNGGALMQGMASRELNQFYAGVVSESSDPLLADEMESLVKATQSPDAYTLAQRTGNAIRVRARQRAALLPQLRSYFR
jgi:aminopeptidase N